MKALSTKQRRFIAEYLVDLNATQAAIRAGFRATAAAHSGRRLLSRADVRAALQEAETEALEQLGVTRFRVLTEAARIAYSDPGAWFDVHEHLRPIGDLPVQVRAAIGSIEVKRGKTTSGVWGAVASVTDESLVKIKSWDKPRALELLARHLGLLKETVIRFDAGAAAIAFTLIFPSPRVTSTSTGPE